MCENVLLGASWWDEMRHLEAIRRELCHASALHIYVGNVLFSTKKITTKQMLILSKTFF